MNIVIAVAALALSAYSAYSFFKAGKFKAFSSKDTLLGAGFGWIEAIPMAAVRLIAWLEILGAVGVVLAPLVAWFVPGLEWVKWFGVAAALGLALTMVVAAIVHISRKEFAYTWKMNLTLFAVAALAGVFQLLVAAPLFG
jgi:Co/Zn/Cd efflux system component